jgi:tol-pal system protein YbgF
MEDLETEMRRLTGMMESLRSSGGDKQAIADLQKRVAFIERQLGIEPPRTGSEQPTPTPVLQSRTHPQAPSPQSTQRRQETEDATSVEIRDTPLPEDERAYREAYEVYRKGSLDESIKLFKQFLKKYPNSRLASNAVYSVGEALFSRGRYDEAVLQFDRVIKEFPGSNKVVTALLKQGQSFNKMGDVRSARIILEKLVKEHPHTAQARMARTTLKSIPAK